MITSRTARRTFRRNSYPEHLRITAILRKETVGGALLLAATIAALIWANSPGSESYFALRDAKIGFNPFGLKLDLSLGAWASDGLLAIFFFIAGLELKREFIAGDLRRFDRAIVPIAAAIGGVAVPAIIYTLINLSSGAEILNGWAIPTATDIAFALAVLAVISTHLPTALRTFLLTLAVVDDLIAISIIAVFYPHNLQPQYLALALIPLGLFTWAVQKRIRSWYLLLPLAIITWVLVHESGVHATVAGVLLAFAVPVVRRDRNPDNGPGLAEHFEHRFRPLSAGVAVPIFAFFSAGVAIGGWAGFTNSLTDTVAIGIIAALILGKAIGIFGATFLITKTTRASLDDGLSWIDVLGLAILAGIGFTVSLLISELAFGADSPHNDHAKVAILTASLVAALLATVILRIRNQHYRKLEKLESVDADGDGVPDVFDEKDD
ncbi:Na+/H+ antiporter [Renibacterium salmoninarum ATCC 33209]|uniref:Na(+)/H(+) antiporter NhaA n=1 Tax=Renibacterium salmoninarum (strain ATCC 33209 / DSM 20767 / JCM 11484 / NBRC 15589 / NCIMB 2235) TaxID=288705 RepID=NHAA_RENSM|nr:Na+/H+ antiporter NhaA [Renibacterium salmoninarum]A9WU27.1 RecName: Full=Na(+)/H(+) antiporter NhaA; AltName: Full=Sodium/proton antiporter NhaA [Renibacterium salmoninarum ATCC 33209]ABY24698.1 Na+/H+ antiporter [Renibacterium salmoninarum ATCC 33209]